MFIKSLQNQNTSQTSTTEHFAAIETQCSTLPESKGLLGACWSRHGTGPGARQTSWVRFFPLLPAQNLQGCILQRAAKAWLGFQSPGVFG